MKLPPRILDISPLISSRLGVFPGDTPFRRMLAFDFAKQDHMTLSSVETTLHLGAHADAPIHYTAQGAGVDEVDLSRYLGPCLVVDARAPRGERVRKSHLSAHDASWPIPRILVRTGSFPDPNNWNHDFSSLAPELIEEWARAGVILVGIDTPSIDPETSKDLPAHRSVARHGLSILEGLVLDHVTPGEYTLVALPLKLEGADASPVRAVLLADDPSS